MNESHRLRVFLCHASQDNSIAIFVTAFLALYGAKVVLSVMQISSAGIPTPVIVIAMIGAIFLWLER